MSREHLDQIVKKRKWAHQKLLDRKSKVYEAFLQMEKAAFESVFSSKE